MAGKVMHMVNRNGRYHARIVVPKELRGIIGKTELRSPLGGDYRQALRLLPGAVAQLQLQIAQAEKKAGKVSEDQPLRFPMTPQQMAYNLYTMRLQMDEELRNDPKWASIPVDDHKVARLRDAVAGRASDDELLDLVGAPIEWFRSRGNIDAAPGSAQWREIARALCHGELEALARVYERDEGDFAGEPTSPIIRDAKPVDAEHQPVSIKRLWTDYVAMRQQVGSMRDGGKRQRPVIEDLRKFLKHDDAARLTRSDVIAWRDHLSKDKSAKTVSDVYLSTVRSLLNWAVENEKLRENAAANVRQPKQRKVYGRERGYTDTEALKVLKMSRSYTPNADEKGRIREVPQLSAAKQWVPILCAFTGARVSEITQLRKEDLRQVGDTWVARITPDAGTVKAGSYRDVPLHPQIIEEGFADFVASAAPGPLFHNGAKPEHYEQRSKRNSNRLAQWLSESGVTPEGLQPNHAWRHRLKTQCRELGISDRVIDAIQGHAGRTSGDKYGDVTLKTKIDAINQLPSYRLIMNSSDL